MRRKAAGSATAPEQECGWVMAHKNALAQEGNSLVIHDEGSVYRFQSINAGKINPGPAAGRFSYAFTNGPACGFRLCALTRHKSCYDVSEAPVSEGFAGRNR
jgi:hypothetical protein